MTNGARRLKLGRSQYTFVAVARPRALARGCPSRGTESSDMPQRQERVSRDAIVDAALEVADQLVRRRLVHVKVNATLHQGAFPNHQ